MTKLMDEFKRYHAGEVTWLELQDYIANFTWAPDSKGTRDPNNPDEAFLEPLREDSHEEVFLAATMGLITVEQWAQLIQTRRALAGRR